LYLSKTAASLLLENEDCDFFDRSPGDLEEFNSMKLTIRSTRHSWQLRTFQKNIIGMLPLVKASAKISAAAK